MIYLGNKKVGVVFVKEKENDNLPSAIINHELIEKPDGTYQLNIKTKDIDENSKSIGIQIDEKLVITNL